VNKTVDVVQANVHSPNQLAHLRVCLLPGVSVPAGQYRAALFSEHPVEQAHKREVEEGRHGTSEPVFRCIHDHLSTYKMRNSPQLLFLVAMRPVEIHAVVEKRHHLYNWLDHKGYPDNHTESDKQQLTPKASFPIPDKERQKQPRPGNEIPSLECLQGLASGALHRHRVLPLLPIVANVF